MTDLHWTAGLHHDGSALYVSNPTPRLGERVRITLRTPQNAPIERIFLRTVPDGENHMERMHEERHDGTNRYYVADLPAHMPRNNYRFKILTDEGAYYYNQAGVSRYDVLDYHDFKLLADYQDPAWTQQAVFYQIFPDRFRQGDPNNVPKPGAWSARGFSVTNRPWGAPTLPWKEAGNLDFYGGDLPGIGQKIDYLLELGINALYLNPIFDSRSNHRYDVYDFFHIDRGVGGDEALAKLRADLSAAGIRLILDVTLNHIGSASPWFQDALNNPDSEYAEFFTIYERPDQYEMWMGVPSLPKINYRSEQVRDIMLRNPDSVLRHWMKPPYSIDGWRLDVQNTQARQGATQLGNKVGRILRKAIKTENPEAYIFGENFYDATSHLQGDELDGIMNYNGFTIPLWRWLAGKDQGLDFRPEISDTTPMTAQAFNDQLTQYRAAIPWVLARHQFNLLDSHDTSRILRKMDGDKTLLKLAASLLMTYPGTPCIYYGTEIGMDGGHDPDCRRCMPWDEAQWDTELRDEFRKMIQLRKTAPALIDGGYQHLYADDGLLVFQRQSKEQRLVIVCYRGPGDVLERLIPVWHSGIAEGGTLVNIDTGDLYRVEGGNIPVYRLNRGDMLILEERE